MKTLFVIAAVLGLATACCATTQTAVVPEPSSLVALGAGGIGLAVALWRRR